VRHINRNSNGDLSEVYNTFNEDRKRVVETVVSIVCSDGNPIRLIISGHGVTGKSRVIDVINRIISDMLQYNPLPVIIAAPTGFSACNIGGTRSHRFIQLPIEHLKPAYYCCLSQDQLNTVRATTEHVRLLIIDEVSMNS
jgi:PIF1-like helicase